MVTGPSLQEVIDMVENGTDDSSPLGRVSAASGLAGDLVEVGDAALGYFVDQARRAGHSWSQIGDAMGVTKQAAQQKHAVRAVSSLEEPELEGFTARARHAVRNAAVVAREWGHDYIGTEHLLLSLYGDPEGLAALILAESGLGEEQANEAIVQLAPRGGGGRDGELPFTRMAKAAVDAARSAAVDLGHGHVGTEHLLIGLDRVDGIAKEVLEHAGLTLEVVHQQVKAKLS